MVCFSCLPGAPPNLDTILQRVLRDPEGCDIDDLFAATGALAGIVTESALSNGGELYRAALRVDQQTYSTVLDAIQDHHESYSESPSIEEIAASSRVQRHVSGDAPVSTGAVPGITSVLSAASCWVPGVVTDTMEKMIYTYGHEIFSMVKSTELMVVFCAGWAAFSAMKRIESVQHPDRVRHILITSLFAMMTLLFIFIAASVVSNLDRIAEKSYEVDSTTETLGLAQAMGQQIANKYGDKSGMYHPTQDYKRNQKTNVFKVGSVITPQLFASLIALAANQANAFLDPTPGVFEAAYDFDEEYSVAQANRNIRDTESLSLVKCLRNYLPGATVENLPTILRSSFSSVVSAANLEDALEVKPDQCYYHTIEGKEVPIPSKPSNDTHFSDIAREVLKDVYHRYDNYIRDAHLVNSDVLRMVGEPVFARISSPFDTDEDFVQEAGKIRFLEDYRGALPTNLVQWISQAIRGLSAMAMPVYLYFLFRRLSRGELQVAVPENRTPDDSALGIAHRRINELERRVNQVGLITRGARFIGRQMVQTGPVAGSIAAVVSVLYNIHPEWFATQEMQDNIELRTDPRYARSIQPAVAQFTSPDPAAGFAMWAAAEHQMTPEFHEEFFYRMRDTVIGSVQAITDAPSIDVAYMLITIGLTLVFKLWQQGTYGSSEENRRATHAYFLLTCGLAVLRGASMVAFD